MEGAQECQGCEQLQNDEADGGDDPVERSEVGDDAGDEECGGHDVTVVVVEEVGPGEKRFWVPARPMRMRSSQ